MKFVLFAAALALTAFAGVSAEARNCESLDGRIQVVVTGTDGYAMQTTLKIDGQEVSRVREFCVWTPSIRRVLRCPHRLSDTVTAEVYPKFPTKQKFEKPTDEINQIWDFEAPMKGATVIISGVSTALSCRSN